MSTTSRGPSRRTLVKGAAWSVPVVAVAGAAPAMAASPPPDECLDIQPGGEACKDPGATQPAFAYNLQYCFTNTCETGTITVNVTRLRAANNNSYDLTINEVLVIPAGEFRCTDVYRVSGSNSSNFQAVHYVVGGVEYIDDRIPAPPNDCLPGELGTSAPAETAEPEAVAPAAETTSTVQDSAKIESTTPVEPSTDAGKTDEASQTAQP